MKSEFVHFWQTAYMTALHAQLVRAPVLPVAAAATATTHADNAVFELQKQLKKAEPTS